jgi:sulfatase modifying factor 1
MKSPWLAVFVVPAIAFLSLAQANSDKLDKAPPSAADPMTGNKPGQVRDDNGLKMKLVWCPPGAVTMEDVEVNEEPAAKNVDKPGNDDDDPIGEPAPQPRKTTRITPVKAFLTKGYWLGKFEVTQSEWKQVMKTEPWKGQDFAKEGADFPATYISWNDATDFCRKLTEQERRAGRLPEGWEYRLPTEAQWERACRARTETKFSFGDDESQLDEYAWFGENVRTAAHPVGQKKPNPWGLQDMHGNVWEWCRDSYAEILPGGRDPEVNLEVATKPSLRVCRGGSWCFPAAFCRSAYRNRGEADYPFVHCGLRVALGAVHPAK